MFLPSHAQHNTTTRNSHTHGNQFLSHNTHISKSKNKKSLDTRKHHSREVHNGE